MRNLDMVVMIVTVLAIFTCSLCVAVHERNKNYYQAVCEQQAGGKYETHHEGWIICSNISTRDVWIRTISE